MATQVLVYKTRYFSFVFLSDICDSGLACAGVFVVVTYGEMPQNSSMLPFIIPPTWGGPKSSCGEQWQSHTEDASRFIQGLKLATSILFLPTSSMPCCFLIALSPKASSLFAKDQLVGYV